MIETMHIEDIREECEKEKFIKLHRQLWWRIAKDIALKWSFLKVHSIFESHIDWDVVMELKEYYSRVLSRKNIMNNCFACEYASQVKKKIYNYNNEKYYLSLCQFCPFFWDSNKTKTSCCTDTDIYEDETKYDMLYKLFPIETDEDMKKVIKMCCRIAELPVNDELVDVNGVFFKC